jgi:hypothetical protein
MTPHDTPGEKPKYYRLHSDSSVSDVLDNINDDDMVHAITDMEVDPYDTGEGYYDQHAVRASDEERAAWAKAYETFTAELQRADDKLAAARAAWESAQSRHWAAFQDAWTDYAPTDAALTARRDEVVEMRREAEEEERRAEARAAQEAQDREDAELGPRTWVTFTPRIRETKVAPDMMVPVIHVAGCTVTKGHENLSYPNAYKYARKAEVQEVLLAGAFRYARGRATADRLPTKLCGRCKPGESLHKALGAVYEDWLEAVESTQDPMPTTKGMASALGLKDEWRSYRTPGYTVMSSKFYRDEKLIEPYEEMIGWYNPDTGTVVPNAEALARLEEILPGRGFAVRRVKEPARYGVGDKECESAVAVRRMTKAEIRRRKEGGATPAAVVNLEEGS